MLFFIGAIAVLALLMGNSARKRVQEVEDKFITLRAEAGSAKQEAEEATKALEQQAKFMEALARGDDVDPLMIREGRLYRNVDAKQLQELVEAGETYVVDVRTPQEWQSGHIAEAVHIPMDELESRLNELRRDGTPVHFICAGGGRSSAAAGIVANRGYRNVFNVSGGMQSYRGEVAR